MWRHILSLTPGNDLPALMKMNDREKVRRLCAPSNVYSTLAGARMPLHKLFLLLAACERAQCVWDQQYTMYKMVNDHRLKKKSLAWLGYCTWSKSSVAAFNVSF